MRVHLQLTGGADNQPGDLLPATMRPPQNDLAPKFTATSSELRNALTIELDQQNRFSVHPGADGRSTSILVPSSLGDG